MIYLCVCLCYLWKALLVHMVHHHYLIIVAGGRATWADGTNGKQHSVSPDKLKPVTQNIKMIQ